MSNLYEQMMNSAYGKKKREPRPGDLIEVTHGLWDHQKHKFGDQWQNLLVMSSHQISRWASKKVTPDFESRQYHGAGQPKNDHFLIEALIEGEVKTVLLDIESFRYINLVENE